MSVDGNNMSQVYAAAVRSLRGESARAPAGAYAIYHYRLANASIDLKRLKMTCKREPDVTEIMT